MVGKQRSCWEKKNAIVPSNFQSSMPRNDVSGQHSLLKQRTLFCDLLREDTTNGRRSQTHSLLEVCIQFVWKLLLQTHQRGHESVLKSSSFYGVVYLMRRIDHPQVSWLMTFRRTSSGIPSIEAVSYLHNLDNAARDTPIYRTMSAYNWSASFMFIYRAA